MHEFMREMHWIYNFPSWLLGFSLIALFTGIALAGVWVQRRFGPHVWRDSLEAQNDLINNYLSAIGVFYGLTVGLIAVAAWENLSSMDDLVSHEAAAVSVLYTAFEGYPPDTRDRLRTLLVQYIHAVVEVEWPDQQKAKTASEGRKYLKPLVVEMLHFEPKTEGMNIVHGSALGTLNELGELRRERISQANDGMPGTLWAVVLFGAFVILGLACLFRTESIVLHLILNGSIGAILGLQIFIILALDHPFWGDLSVSSQPFQDLLDILVTQ
jgi:hypothetical protein